MVSPSVNGTLSRFVLKTSADPGCLLVLVTNWQLVTLAPIPSSAVLKVGATICGPNRLVNGVRDQRTCEHGGRACRCNSLTHQQAMRVCVGPDVIWLDFVSPRPLPLEGGETTISKLCPIADRLTNLLQNHCAEAFRQINDQIEGSPPVTLSGEVFLDETLDDRPDKAFFFAVMERLVPPVFLQGGAGINGHDRGCHRTRREARSLQCSPSERRLVGHFH